MIESQHFEEQYIALREKEHRIYSDEEVKQLPRIPAAHKHHAEWRVRGGSAKRLVKYLRNKKRFLTILEVGCGNGWLTNKVARETESHVTGIDLNQVELEQARRIFGEERQLAFEYGDIQNGVLQNRIFDMIIFASSIQYFRSLPETIAACNTHLDKWGEIHIIDSPFYNTGELAEARLRTQMHFEKMGQPEMAEHYFHHSYSEIMDFAPVVLYDPGSLMNKLLLRRNPFPWFCIKKE